MTDDFSQGPARTIDITPQARRNPYTVTYTLIAMNVLVFLAMVARGVPFLEPTSRDVIPWGADFGPLTVGAGQWWRLLTCCFVHFGIIHIGMNMFVLYQIGPFIDQVFGRVRYLLLYLFAGLGGSLVSLLVHPMTTSAGASGAIFGLYGAVFGFLLIERRSLASGAATNIARSAGIFIVYNFIFGGVRGGTDIAAHLGGLFAGFLAGVLLVRRRAGGPWRVPLAASVVVLAAILGAGVVALAQRPENRDPANAFMATIITSTTMPIGDGGRLVYNGDVTEADARKLSEALNGTELGKVKGVMIVYSKSKGKTSLSIPLGSGESADKDAQPWNDPDVVHDFTIIGQQIAPAVGGPPYDLLLLNSDGIPERTISITGQ